MNYSEPSMRLGVVAYLDALGFKGIWQKHGYGKVLSKLRRLEVVAKTDRFQVASSSESSPISSMGHKTTFLSDSIFIFYYLDNYQEDDDWESDTFALRHAGEGLAATCDIIRDILWESTRTDPVLAYRGCITVGKFAFLDNFLVGPAIDEAVEQEKRAQGAFVYLSEIALKCLEAVHGSEGQQAITSLHQNCKIPLKTVHSEKVVDFKTAVIKPTSGLPYDKDRFLASFDDHEFYKDNTQKLLEKMDGT